VSIADVAAARARETVCSEFWSFERQPVSAVPAVLAETYPANTKEGS
jgi:hypothetical protein